MRKKIFISSLILSGSLFLAGFAVGQLNQPDQGQTDCQTQQQDQTPGITRQPFGEIPQQDTENPDLQQSPQQQIPLQQQFGVSPQFEPPDETPYPQQPTQEQSEKEPVKIRI